MTQEEMVPEVISQVREVNWPLALDLLKGVELVAIYKTIYIQEGAAVAGGGLGHLASTCVEGVEIAAQG